MRLDKFLKVSRIIKRRSVADDACSGGRVSINGKSAKSAKIVKVGDILEIAFGDNSFKVRILQVPQGNVDKAQADSLYQVITEEENEQL